jgi:hypothetical protein
VSSCCGSGLAGGGLGAEAAWRGAFFNWHVVCMMIYILL